MKLFILGLPGSGKSTIAGHITIYLEDKNWKSTRFSDHVILQKMFQDDTEGKQFKPTKHGGFDVLDLTVLDIALRRLEQEVKKQLSSAIRKEIVLIEFARNDYQVAFQQFSHEFLQDAYFLYLEVNIETCKRRIRERTDQPRTKDDFFVSEDIFNDYYNEDNGRSLPQILKRGYRIDEQKIKIMGNNSLLQDIVAQINWFVDIICVLESI